MKPLKVYRLKDPANGLRWRTEVHDDTVYFCFDFYVVASSLLGPQRTFRKTPIGKIQRGIAVS